MKRGGSGLLALGVGIAGLLMLGTEAPSPSSVLDRLRGRKGPVVPQALPGWPLDPGSITRIGESLGAPRVQHTHQGVDLFVPAGSPVVAPADLRIVRVVNGSAQESASAQRAGMWV